MTFNGVVSVHKRCQCGNEMKLLLRTVVYAGKTEIANVPIFSCGSCSQSEVLYDVKRDLKELIANLGSNPDEHPIRFEDCNELVDVLYEVFTQGRAYANVRNIEAMLEERINQLLDLYLLARSLSDRHWTAEIEKRLTQITSFSLHAYRSNAK